MLEQLSFQVLQFIFDISPFFRVFRSRLHLGDNRPDLTELGIQLEEMLLILGQLILGIYGVHRALGFAQTAVDTFLGIDYQKIRPFMEAVYRAYLDTVRMLTPYAGLHNNVCHYLLVVDNNLTGAGLYYFQFPFRSMRELKPLS
jgi:hypothetical protein